MEQLLAKARRIRVAVFDVDGVLTDGTLYFGANGEELKAFNILDGHGIKMLKNAGIEPALITSRTSPAVALRAQNLGIGHVFQGSEDKLNALRTLLARLGFEPIAAAYMGDDVIDLPVLRRCGLAITVANAPLVVKQHADYVTRVAGGRGAVREACELILEAQGTLAGQLAPYLE